MLFSGEVVDTIADYIAVFVLLFVPALLLYVFWMVHIMPEKIAERRGHPQADAIKTLCLLSLVFGGLLWPVAWIWAYSRPVLYKMAYGTDRVEHTSGPDPTAGESTSGHLTEGATPAAAPPVAAPKAPDVAAAVAVSLRH